MRLSVPCVWRLGACCCGLLLPSLGQRLAPRSDYGGVTLNRFYPPVVGIQTAGHQATGWCSNALPLSEGVGVQRAGGEGPRHTPGVSAESDLFWARELTRHRRFESFLGRRRWPVLELCQKRLLDAASVPGQVLKGLVGAAL